MTVNEAIKQWLYKNPLLKIDDKISTEILKAEAVAYALSKTPTTTIETFVDGSQLRTEYYMFFARQSTQLESERISNDEFLEKFESWVDEKNLSGDLPVIDKKRIVDEVGVSSTFYLYEQDEEESIYTFTIMIKYRKEV